MRDDDKSKNVSPGLIRGITGIVVGLGVIVIMIVTVLYRFCIDIELNSRES